MRFQPFLSSGVWRWTLIGLAVAVLPGAATAHAQAACKLLQPAEVESALKEWSGGGKTTPFVPSAADSGGIAYDICNTEIPRPGLGALQITVSIVGKLPMSGLDAIRVRNGALAREKQWTVQGAQFSEKTVNKALCSLYGRPGVAAHSVCAIPGANGYVEVDVVAPSLKDVPSIDAVGALAQKANAQRK